MPIGAALQKYACFDFGGGLDIKSSPAKLALRANQDRLLISSNTVYNPDGGVAKRLDQDIYNSLGNLGAAVAITGGIQYSKSAGTYQIVCGTSDGRIVRLLSDGTTSNLATGYTIDTRWSFAIFNDNLIVCNGVDAPSLYDGTTVTTPVGVTGGFAPTVHRNRVWMLNNVTKSKVSWSALNNEQDWTTVNNAGSVFVNPNDGQNCTGLLSLLDGELEVQKANNFYRIQGATYDEFSVVPVSHGSGIGGLAFQAFLQADNDAFFVSTHGIHSLAATQRFGDIRESAISTRIAPYFEPRSSVPLLLALLKESRAIYDRPNNRLIFSVPAS